MALRYEEEDAFSEPVPMNVQERQATAAEPSPETGSPSVLERLAPAVAGAAIAGKATLLTVTALQSYAPNSFSYEVGAVSLLAGGIIARLMCRSALKKPELAAAVGAASIVFTIVFVSLAQGPLSSFLFFYVLGTMLLLRVCIRQPLSYFLALAVAILTLIPIQRSAAQGVVTSYASWEESVFRSTLPAVGRELEGTLLAPGTSIEWSHTGSDWGIMDDPKLDSWNPFYGRHQWVARYRGRISGSDRTISAFAASGDAIILRIDDSRDAGWSAVLTDESYQALIKDTLNYVIPGKRWYYWAETEKGQYLEAMSARGLTP